MNVLLSWLIQRINRPEYGFSAAYDQEPLVFGARRPGFPLSRVPSSSVDAWIAFMKGQGIQRVLCLLPPRQLSNYKDLLDSYRETFGEAQVCWTPIEDFHLAEKAVLISQILPFLAEGERQNKKTVVHCSGGVGRTGHVLAAWLVSFRGMSNEQAIAAVRQSGRNARESRDKNLGELLDTCRESFPYQRTD